MHIEVASGVLSLYTVGIWWGSKISGAVFLLNFGYTNQQHLIPSEYCDGSIVIAFEIRFTWLENLSHFFASPNSCKMHSSNVLT